MKFTFDITNIDLTDLTTKKKKEQIGNIKFAFFQVTEPTDSEEEQELKLNDFWVYLQVIDGKKKKIYGLDRREFYTICKSFVKMEEL